MNELCSLTRNKEMDLQMLWELMLKRCVPRSACNTFPAFCRERKIIVPGEIVDVQPVGEGWSTGCEILRVNEHVVTLKCRRNSLRTKEPRQIEIPTQQALLSRYPKVGDKPRMVYCYPPGRAPKRN